MRKTSWLRLCSDGEVSTQSAPSAVLGKKIAVSVELSADCSISFNLATAKGLRKTKICQTKMDPNQIPQIPPGSGGGFVLEAWHAVLALIAAGGTWAWKYVTGNIKELRDVSVTKTDFSKAIQEIKDTIKENDARATKQRDELRSSVIDLYQSQKSMTEDVNDKFLRLLEAINKKP